MYTRHMFNGSHKRDIGGVFPSADVPGPVFKAPIPYKEIKELAAGADFVKLRQKLNGHAAGAPVAPKPG
jgi:hypothetical protein